MIRPFGNKARARPSDQALAVPVEPVSRLDPSGFDPSRFRNQLNRLRDSQAIPQPNGRVEVDIDALCDVLVTGHDLLELTERVANIDYHEGNCGVLLDETADAIATEARRAETVQHVSVHEGAGPKDIAQTPSVSPLTSKENGS